MRPPLDGTVLAAAREFTALTDTPCYSVHLGFATEEVTPGDENSPTDGVGPLSAAESQERIIRNARVLNGLKNSLMSLGRWKFVLLGGLRPPGAKRRVTQSGLADPL